ncbi:YgiT-type zinc finger protein [Candidatus Acetothermia bacterium]|nr:YgiT-type zinc finger protein [Candidatus Acetothermia bacterium]MBI3459663.1 YgiT-type zinc finger protein [Candidatus Acetothermia bacterium]
MTCALCGGSVRLQQVQEEIVVGTDHYLITVRAEVCQHCSERYYSERTVERLIQLREAIKQGRLRGQAVGQVYELVTK